MNKTASSLERRHLIDVRTGKICEYVIETTPSAFEGGSPRVCAYQLCELTKKGLPDRRSRGETFLSRHASGAKLDHPYIYYSGRLAEIDPIREGKATIGRKRIADLEAELKRAKDALLEIYA